ncbi:hypothetical protein LGR54_06605 [Ancylobacter sp. Lp-2]|uniref:hypothetical protein n=1 Tax=Ancylobacter sp. Lp-2 TaxID=2881339 RepID=UPI001E5A6E29|nr:hypothetical protein [Ancylobacter sp. Lp-2]MCB4768272.1 hypothetical protein [Ancylobacter sp. Lp-2]
MLAWLFWGLWVAGASAIVVLWVFAAGTAYRILTGVRAGGGSNAAADWIKMVVWPFAMRHLAGAPADRAASLSKMLVALFAAFLVATASLAVYSNLTFAPSAQTHQ